MVLRRRRKKKGIKQLLITKLATRIGEFQKRRSEEAAFQRIISKRAEAAARRERAKQEVRLAVASEKIKAQRRLKAFRSGKKPRGALAGLRGFATQFVENVERANKPRKGGVFG